MFNLDAFIFGLSQCLVIGPISLFAIREGLNPQKGFWFQMQVVLGATLVDIFYLLASSYGAAEFIEYGPVKLIMWIIAAYILMVMGWHSLHEKPGRMSFHHVHRHRTQFYKTDFFKAMLINMVNPLAIVFWVVVAGGLYAGMANEISPLFFSANIVVAGLIGSLGVAFLTLFIRHIFHQWMLRKLMQVGSMVLMGNGVYFSYQALLELQPFVVGMLQL